MKTYLLADTHFNPENIDTYCQRPPNYTTLIRNNWKRMLQPTDVLIHLGDVGIGDKTLLDIASLPGRKILIRGNHDRGKGNQWWMENGFDFACDGMVFRDCFLSHEPATRMPGHCRLNIHGHLHNIWTGFQKPGVKEIDHKPYQRLFAVEYTNYAPVEFEKFISHPEKYKSVKPKGEVDG